MKEDAAILLDKLYIALSEFANRLIQGKDTDIVYGNYLKDLLLHTARNYKLLKSIAKSLPHIPYKNLFVVLPGNVPMVFFEVLPISILYGIKTFFKYPKDEKKLYNRFIEFLNANYPEIGIFFNGSYLSHTETEKIIKKYDYLFAFGSDKLTEFLSRAPVPYRFFGPGFSFGVSFSTVSKGILKDTLFFDQKGCLSMKFLFYKQPQTIDILKNIFKKADDLIPPTSIFKRDRFEYQLYSLLPFGDIILKNKESAIFNMNSSRLPDIPLPERTLILKKIDTETDILKFLMGYIHRSQAIATDRPAEIKRLKEYPAFIARFGQLQFQPYNFFFKKGITLENIFSEVKNEN